MCPASNDAVGVATPAPAAMAPIGSTECVGDGESVGPGVSVGVIDGEAPIRSVGVGVGVPVAVGEGVSEEVGLGE